MSETADADWYVEHVLRDTSPGWARPRSVSPTQAWTAWWQGRATDDPVVAAAAQQGFVLASSQLAGLGVSRSTARTRVRRGAWSAPAVGVVAPLAVDDGAPLRVVERRRHALLAAAEALRNPELAVACRSAAILAGLPTRRVPATAELVSPVTGGTGGHTPTHRYRAGLAPRATELWFGTRTTGVARSVVDLARHDRRDGIMAADAALHEQLTTRAELVHALRAASGWPGVVQARVVVDRADARAESPLESISRLAIVDAGLPLPELQYEIDGLWVDMCWPDRRLVLEADGLEKYSGDALQAEKRRERRLRRCGYRVERVTWDDVTRQWPATLRWLSDALDA